MSTSRPGKIASFEGEKRDLTRQLQEMEAQYTDANDAKMKVDSQLSEMLRKSGDRDQHEKQTAMLKADRDARATEANAASAARDAAEAQLARIRGTYDDLVQQRDNLMGKVAALQSEAQMAQTGDKVSDAADKVSDWLKQR